MKNIYLLLFLIPIGAVCWWFFSPQSITDTAIVVMSDETEENFISEPVSAQIKQIYGLYDNIWNGVSYRFVSITDRNYNKTYQARIEPVYSKWEQLFSNELERMGEIKRLYETIDQTLHNSKTDSTGRDSTVSYIPIVRELNRLSQSKAEKRIALIYSDLTENSELLNLYDTVQFNLLNTNPDSVLDILGQHVQLEDLSQIEIHLIYEPFDNTDYNRYRAIVEFYKQILESKGTKVVIQANLTDI